MEVDPVTMTLLMTLFGAIGVAVRYLFELQVQQWTTIDFPLSTFSINCLGSFAIGVIYIAAGEAAVLSRESASLLTVGLLGGFTTFSAFSIQAFQLIERGKLVFAMAYFIGSPLLGLISAGAGVFAARTIWVSQ